MTSTKATRSLLPVESIKERLKTEFRRHRYGRLFEIFHTMREQNAFPAQPLIRYFIGSGEVEGRPYDISSLAVALEVPRTTVFRHLMELHNCGTVQTETVGRRTLINLSDRGWRELADDWDRCDPLIDAFVKEQAHFMRDDESGDGSS